MDLGGSVKIKRFYNTLQTLSGVPAGLSSGDLVAVAGQGGSYLTPHTQTGVYAVAAGAWEMLAVPSSGIKNHVQVADPSTTGTGDAYDGWWTLVKATPTAWKFVRGLG
jgi:hypothetical protein